MAKAKNTQKGPSLSALAALGTLAIALWLEIDLATAVLRSVIVYLVFSLVSMTYKIVLGRYLAISQEKTERELLEKIQREAEEEERKKEEKRKQEEKQKSVKTEVKSDAQQVKEATEESKAEQPEEKEAQTV